MSREADRALKQLGTSLPLKVPLRQQWSGPNPDGPDCQGALLAEAKILIFDEATAALGRVEPLIPHFGELKEARSGGDLHHPSP